MTRLLENSRSLNYAKRPQMSFQYTRNQLMSAEPIVYLNGEFIPASQAKLSLTDWGLYGVAATEMTRTFHQRCFRLDDHLDRLNASLDRLGICVELLRDEWREMTQSVVEHHADLIDPSGELMVNHLVTAGPNPVLTPHAEPQPTVIVQTFPLRFSRWADKYRAGQHLIVPPIRQIPPECIDPRIKSRNRLHWYLADQTARDTASDAMALLCDLDGHLTETSAGNFYIVRENTIMTPRYEVTLGGISRKVVEDIAKYAGIRYESRDIPVSEALAADEAFTSSTSYCLLPVTRINGQKIGDGTTGPVYRRLLEAWSMMVGLDIEEQAVAQAAWESQQRQ